MQGTLTWKLALVLGSLSASQVAAATPNEPEEVADTMVAGAAASDSGAPLASDPPSEGSNGWEFGVTPYLWATALSGDVALARGETVDIDTSFKDILDHLKFTAMVAMDARNDRFVLLGDIVYLSVGIEETGPLGFVEAKVDPSIFIGTLAAGYRVVDQGPLFLDLFAGGRYTSTDVEVELSGPRQTVSRDKSESYFSPVVGARVRMPLGTGWAFALYGDLAGFGVTSDLTWQLMGTIQYDLNEHWRLAAGYRHVSVKSDEQNFDLDLSMSGPIFGVSYRF